MLQLFSSYAPVASARRGHRAFRLSVFAYVRSSVDQVNILSKVESQDLLMVASWYFIWVCISMRPAGIYKSHDLMTSLPIFHGPLTSDLSQIIKVKIFVQGRILSSTNGSKLIFHLRMYLYEASRNIEDPWPQPPISRSANFRLWPIFHG